MAQFTTTSNTNTNNNNNTNNLQPSSSKESKQVKITIKTETHRKEDEIKELLSQPDIDLWKLRDLCITEGGLVNDSLRSKAWPKLVGLTDTSSHTTGNSTTPHKLERQSSSSSRRGGLGPRKKSDLARNKLIDVTVPSSVDKKGFQNQTIAKCLDFDQIGRDITRCTWHLLTGTQRSRRHQMANKHRKKVSTILKRKQRRLGNFINLVLIQSYRDTEGNTDGGDGDGDEWDGDDSLDGDGEEDTEQLRYYQGYHDICSIFLSALGGSSLSANITTPQQQHPPLPTKPNKENKTPFEIDDDSVDEYARHIAAADKTAHAMGLDLPSKVLLKISTSHLRDNLRNDFKIISSALRLFTLPLISAFDPELHSHLYECQMEPFFALSWIITWFSHDVRDTALVKRLFDFFIASHALMPLYMSIAMVCHPSNRTEVLNAECDFASVHKALSQLPRNSCSVGWKLVGTQCDTEYVCENEYEDVRVVDGTSIVGKCKSEDNSRNVGCGDGDETTSINPPSLASSSLLTGGCGSTALVPFQELIELAIEFMYLIPPRELMSLARNYYGTNAELFEQVDTSSIALLQPPPPWATANSVPSDWSLKKRAREMTQTTTNGNKKNSSAMMRRWNYWMRKRDSSGVVEIQHGASYRAVIAAGQGPSGSKDKRRTRRRRKRAKIMAVLVPIISGGVMFLQDLSYADIILFATATIKGNIMATTIKGAAVVDYQYNPTNIGNDGVTETKDVERSMDDQRQNERPFPFFSLAHQTLTVTNGKKTGMEMDTKKCGLENPFDRRIFKQIAGDGSSLWDLGYNQEQLNSKVRSNKKDEPNLICNVDECVEKRKENCVKKQKQKQKQNPLRRFQSWIKAVQKELDDYEDIPF